MCNDKLQLTDDFCFRNEEQEDNFFFNYLYYVILFEMAYNAFKLILQVYVILLILKQKRQSRQVEDQSSPITVSPFKKEEP